MKTFARKNLINDLQFSLPHQFDLISGYQGITRLVNGPTLNLNYNKPACFKGRLEGRSPYWDSGRWKQICDDYHEAILGRIACQDLGFKKGRCVTGDNVGAYNSAYYEYGNDGDFGIDEYILDPTGCSGNEESIFQCQNYG